MAAHGDDNGKALQNQLGAETSPYLLQHAKNPVAWQPWNEETLARARAERLPMLVSVGYSSCHWCHVMAHESFENPEIAAIMNANFICIKVDREERPDIDNLLMEATVRMTGSGGWPMTVFLTPDGAPFFAGTYFPPVDRYGAPGFPRLVEALAAWYREKPEEVEEQAQDMRDTYAANARLRLEVPAGLLDGSERLDPAILARAANADLAGFDAEYGGHQRAPKFPHSLGLAFLLRMEQRRRSPAGASDPAVIGLSDELAPLVTCTLDRMAAGGIHDQIGGGFHRYSTDVVWLVPHFEKMLTDNALLALVYLRAWQVFDTPYYRDVCERTLDYILREMTGPSGAFYSSQDADSEGEEGRFYTWTGEELRAALGEDDAALAQIAWGATERGHFEGRSILHVARPIEEVAKRVGIPVDDAAARLASARDRLYVARSARVWPGRDDKAITAWNALALRAFAEAAGSLGRDDYRHAAEASAAFLTREMSHEGRLLRTWRLGAAKIDAYLDDYGALANALVSMYELTGDAQYISQARVLADTIINQFWDDDIQGFFDTPRDHEPLIGRPREMADNATPSGASLACEALLRLAALTGDPAYRERATRTLLSFAPRALRTPSAFGHMLCGLDDLIGPFHEVALVGDDGDPRLDALRAVVARRWRPRQVVAIRAEDDTVAAQAVPLLEGRTLVSGEPAAYVCQEFACQRPVTHPADLQALLDD